jgi:hypothetical protein
MGDMVEPAADAALDARSDTFAARSIDLDAMAMDQATNQLCKDMFEQTEAKVGCFHHGKLCVGD